MDIPYGRILADHLYIEINYILQNAPKKHRLKLYDMATLPQKI